MLIVGSVIKGWSVQFYRVHYLRPPFGLINYHATNSRARSRHMIMKFRIAQNSLLLARGIVGKKTLEVAFVSLV